MYQRSKKKLLIVYVSFGLDSRFNTLLILFFKSMKKV